ncbi:hypothetical protein BDW75DRAFT_197259 [Aspergillus navahoensis]
MLIPYLKSGKPQSHSKMCDIRHTFKRSILPSTCRFFPLCSPQAGRNRKVKENEKQNGSAVIGTDGEQLTVKSITTGEDDRLFRADYEHSSPEGSGLHCNEQLLISPPQGSGVIPPIHYGPIASVSQVVRNGELRGRLAARPSASKWKPPA